MGSAGQGERSGPPIGVQLEALSEAALSLLGGKRAHAGAAGTARSIHPGFRDVTIAAQAHLGPSGGSRARTVAAEAAAMLRRRVVGIADPCRRADVLVVAALALARQGRRVHVVSLSGAKAGEMADRAAPAFRACGVSFACIPDAADFEARRAGYRSAVVFASLSRLAQDRLRDEVEAADAIRGARAHVRRLSARDGRAAALLPASADALVDDADLLMLESPRPVRFAEAADPDLGRLYADQAFAILSMFDRDRHYSIDPTTMRVGLTEAGRARLDTFAVLFGGAWSGSAWREETVLAALTIRDLFRPKSDYGIENGQVVMRRGSVAPGVVPSIADLIAAKESLRGAPGLAHLSDTRRTFLGYARLGGAAPVVTDLAREFAASYGLKVWAGGQRGGRSLTVPSVHASRGAMLDAAAGLLVRPESTWVWAPARDDAVDLPSGLRACRLLVAEEPFGEIDAPEVVVQLGAAQLRWELRIVEAFPEARRYAFVSAEDGFLASLVPGDARVARFAAAPGLATYRAAQAAVAAELRTRRLAHLASSRYFDRILSFLGESP